MAEVVATERPAARRAGAAAAAQPVDERLAAPGPDPAAARPPGDRRPHRHHGDLGVLLGVAPSSAPRPARPTTSTSRPTLGIMAVAVSLLMIGGEFDLSSGAMTGATAMLVILLSRRSASSAAPGSRSALAVPLSLAFALTIGWFNGTIVDKTRLPSFIVTLGTFFVLIGAKLGFSKLFVGQVVGRGHQRGRRLRLLAQGLRRLVDPQRPPMGGPRHVLDRPASSSASRWSSSASSS